MGFTLIEVLVVIAIIGLLATTTVIALDNARKRTRDTRRLGDFKQYQTALNLYYEKNGAYPTGEKHSIDCTRFGITDIWDLGFEDPYDGEFIQPLKTNGVMGETPGDPNQIGCEAYRYVRVKNPGVCNNKPLYVLAAELETLSESDQIEDPCINSSITWNNPEIADDWYVIMKFGPK